MSNSILRVLLLSRIDDASSLVRAMGETVYREQIRVPYLKLARATAERFSGYEIKSKSDSLSFAFASVELALSYAAVLQQGLRSHGLIAMDRLGRSHSATTCAAIHTPARIPISGQVSRTDTSEKEALLRLASLMVGGQVLVSNTAYLAAHEPTDYLWQEWPDRRIASVEQAESIWELLWDQESRGEPGQRWLPRELAGASHRYVPQPTRQNEVLRAFAQRLPNGEPVRLVTILGGGGIGKTRLGVAAAIQAVGAFRDGLRFVRLDQLKSPETVAEAIGATMGWVGSSALPGKLMKLLRHKELLLLLDSFEKVDTAEVAAFLEDLLSKARRLFMIVMGRKAASLQRECPFHLLTAGLALDEAKRLFLARALSSRTPEPQALEGDIYLDRMMERIKCIPLGIELAAGQIHQQSLRDMINGIETTPFPGGPAQLNPQTNLSLVLERCLIWSFGLLDESEQQALMRLSVFADSFTPESAATICAIHDAQKLLDQLTDTYFIRRLGSAEPPRYFLPPAVREFVRERLESSPFASAIRQRYAHYYRHLIADCCDFNNRARLDLFQAEGRNALAALEMAIQMQDASAACFMAEYFCGYADYFGLWDEIGRLTRDCIELTHTAGNRPIRAMLLNNLGMILGRQERYEEAENCCQRSLDIFREFGSYFGEGQAMSNLGVISRAQGKLQQAEAYFQLSLGISREHSSRIDESCALNNLGQICLSQERWIDAEAFYVECLAICWELADRHGAGECLNHVGFICEKLERWTDAEAYFKQSLSIYREQGNRAGVGQVFRGLGRVYERQERWTEAETCYRESIGIFQVLGDRRKIAELLRCLAGMKFVRHDTVAGVSLEHEARILEMAEA